LLAVLRCHLRDAKLRDEAVRSAKSTCLNCAEGAGRVTRADKARAFAIARAEAVEAAAAVEIAVLCGDAPAEPAREVARSPTGSSRCSRGCAAKRVSTIRDHQKPFVLSVVPAQRARSRSTRLGTHGALRLRGAAHPYAQGERTLPGCFRSARGRLERSSPRSTPRTRADGDRDPTRHRDPDVRAP